MLSTSLRAKGCNRSYSTARDRLFKLARPSLNFQSGTILPSLQYFFWRYSTCAKESLPWPIKDRFVVNFSPSAYCAATRLSWTDLVSHHTGLEPELTRRQGAAGTRSRHGTCVAYRGLARHGTCVAYRVNFWTFPLWIQPILLIVHMNWAPGRKVLWVVVDNLRSGYGSSLYLIQLKYIVWGICTTSIEYIIYPDRRACGQWPRYGMVSMISILVWVTLFGMGIFVWVFWEN